MREYAHGTHNPIERTAAWYSEATPDDVLPTIRAEAAAIDDEDVGGDVMIYDPGKTGGRVPSDRWISADISINTEDCR